VVGVGFAALGVAFVIYGYVRQRAVDAAIAQGRFASPDAWLVAALAIAGVVLGLAMLVIVVVEA
jgi:hypothetical protein